MPWFKFKDWLLGIGNWFTFMFNGWLLWAWGKLEIEFIFWFWKNWPCCILLILFWLIVSGICCCCWGGCCCCWDCCCCCCCWDCCCCCCCIFFMLCGCWSGGRFLNKVTLLDSLVFTCFKSAAFCLDTGLSSCSSICWYFRCCANWIGVSLFLFKALTE